MKVGKRMWSKHSKKGNAIFVNIYYFCLFKINLKTNLKRHLWSCGEAGERSSSKISKRALTEVGVVRGIQIPRFLSDPSV